MLKRGLPEDNRLKSVTVMALNCKPPKMDVPPLIFHVGSNLRMKLKHL